MSRQKDKGTKFETAVVRYLRRAFGDSEGTIRRLAPAGAYDRGDVGGVTCRGVPVVVECKDHARTELAEWWRETEREMGNADTDLGAVVWHRRGVGEGDMGSQWVVMDLRTLCRMLGGTPD